jgi:hypothetical protein
VEVHLKKALFASAPLVFLVCANRAKATTVTTTSYSVWKTGLTGNPIELDFTKIKNTNYKTASGITLAPLQGPALSFVITGPDGAGYTLAGGFYGNIVSLFGASDGTGYIRIDLPAGGENAILLGLATQPAAHLTVKLSDQESFAVSNGLFGLVLSHDISWLTISTTNGAQPVLEDFFFGNGNLAQDPVNQSESGETAPALMIGGGLLILFGARRKFKHRMAARG